MNAERKVVISLQNVCSTMMVTVDIPYFLLLFPYRICIHIVEGRPNLMQSCYFLTECMYPQYA